MVEGAEVGLRRRGARLRRVHRARPKEEHSAGAGEGAHDLPLRLAFAFGRHRVLVQREHGGGVTARRRKARLEAGERRSDGFAATGQAPRLPPEPRDAELGAREARTACAQPV